MQPIILKGHKVAKGNAKGVALVCQSSISFYGGVNQKTALVVEKGHELEGESISDKILVFPAGKGGGGGTHVLFDLAHSHLAPKAIINHRTNPIIAVGVIMGEIPTMDRVEPDPLAYIHTGDWVEVDADAGIIKVWSME